MKYAVNEAGVSALQNISTALMTSATDLFEKTSQLQAITSDNEDSLGPHKVSLNQAIIEIYIGLKESAESINVLAETAKRQFTPIQARRIATSMRPCEALKNNLIPVITNARLISIKPYQVHRFLPIVLCTAAYHQKRSGCCECCQIICWSERRLQIMDL